jgi:cytochrome c
MEYKNAKFLIALAVTMPLGLAAANAAGDATAGASVFQSQCAMCHSASPGVQGIGPSLAGIVNKPAAATPGYQFSPVLKSAHLVWNAAALDKFLAGPQSDVPGTKMPYAGLPDAGQRADVIAYLATLHGK